MTERLTSEQATKVYHLIRSVEILTNLTPSFTKKGARQTVDSMKIAVLNQVSMELGISGSWYMDPDAD